MSLEAYFAPFRANIIGLNQDFESPYGRQRILYADWTASGRMFGPIEKMLSEEIAPFVGNTHTETSVTGTTMTRAYYYKSWWGLIGIVPLLTAIFRFCPAYLPFGLSSCSSKSEPKA